MQRKLKDYLLLMLYLYLPRAMSQSWRDVDLDVFPRRESWEMIESSHILYRESVLRLDMSQTYMDCLFVYSYYTT
jgi:hypothetical protein